MITAADSGANVSNVAGGEYDDVINNVKGKRAVTQVASITGLAVTSSTRTCMSKLVSCDVNNYVNKVEL